MIDYRIDNLVLLPRSLHARYHMQKNSIPASLTFILTCDGSQTQPYRMLRGLLETMNDCAEWMRAKERADKYLRYGITDFDYFEEVNRIHG